MDDHTTNLPAVKGRTKSVLIAMSDRYGMEPAAFEATVRATCMAPDKNGRVPSREEFAAFLLVAREYKLNPLTKEIYAFSAKGGGIVPIVSIDGWMNLINSHPAFDGMEFDENHDGAKLISTTCTIYRKDRSKPIRVTEYLDECIRPTDPWKMKHRMLRHKSAIQCSRYAFGFAGIYDEDEGAIIAQSGSASVQIEPPAGPPPPPPAEPKTIEHQPEPKSEPKKQTKAKEEPKPAAKEEPEVQDFTAAISEFEAAAETAMTHDALTEHFEQIQPFMEDMDRRQRTRIQNAYEDAQERIDRAEAAAEKAAKEPPQSAPPADDDDFPGDRPSVEEPKEPDYVTMDRQLAEKGDPDADQRTLARERHAKGHDVFKRFIGGRTPEQMAIIEAMPDYAELMGK